MDWFCWSSSPYIFFAVPRISDWTQNEPITVLDVTSLTSHFLQVHMRLRRSVPVGLCLNRVATASHWRRSPGFTVASATSGAVTEPREVNTYSGLQVEVGQSSPPTHPFLLLLQALNIGGGWNSTSQHTDTLKHLFCCLVSSVWQEAKVDLESDLGSKLFCFAWLFFWGCHHCRHSQTL